MIFTLPISAETRILQMLKKLWVLPVDIRLAAHAAKLRFRPRAYSYIGNIPVLDVFDNTQGATSWRHNHPHPAFSADGKRVYYNVNDGLWTRLMVAEVR